MGYCWCHQQYPTFHCKIRLTSKKTFLNICQNTPTRISECWTMTDWLGIRCSMTNWNWTGNNQHWWTHRHKLHTQLIRVHTGLQSMGGEKDMIVQLCEDKFLKCLLCCTQNSDLVWIFIQHHPNISQQKSTVQNRKKSEQLSAILLITYHQLEPQQQRSTQITVQQKLPIMILIVCHTEVVEILNTLYTVNHLQLITVIT